MAVSSHTTIIDIKKNNLTFYANLLLSFKYWIHHKQSAVSRWNAHLPLYDETVKTVIRTIYITYTLSKIASKFNCQKLKLRHTSSKPLEIWFHRLCVKIQLAGRISGKNTECFGSFDCCYLNIYIYMTGSLNLHASVSCEMIGNPPCRNFQNLQHLRFCHITIRHLLVRFYIRCIEELNFFQLCPWNSYSDLLLDVFTETWDYAFLW